MLKRILLVLALLGSLLLSCGVGGPAGASSCSQLLSGDLPLVVQRGDAFQAGGSGGDVATLALSLPGGTQNIAATSTGPAYSFQLPVDLPANQAIPYVLTVKSGTTTCTTASSSLRFYVSDLGGRLAVERGDRMAVVTAARELFDHATAAAGITVSSEAQLADLCSRLFVINPSPCDVQSVLTRPVTQSTRQPASPPTMQVVKADPGGVGIQSTLCKTVRFRNIADDFDFWYWDSFSTTEPGATTLFGQGMAEAHPHSLENAASLFSEVGRANPVPGELFSIARGNIGYWMRLNGPVGTLTIEPKIAYTVLGNGMGMTWTYPPPFPPGDAHGHSQVSVFPKSTNFGTGSGSGGDGSEYVDRVESNVDLVPVPNLETRDWDHSANSGPLPSLTAVSGTTVAAYTWVRAESLATSAGNAAGGGMTNFEEPEASVYADYADFTITSPPEFYWNDPVRCID